MHTTISVVLKKKWKKINHQTTLKQREKTEPLLVILKWRYLNHCVFEWEMMQWIHSSDSVVCSRHQRYISLFDFWTWYSFFVNNSFSFFFEEFMFMWEIQELEHFLRYTIFAKLMNIKTNRKQIWITLQKHFTLSNFCPYICIPNFIFITLVTRNFFLTFFNIFRIFNHYMVF